MNTSQYSQIGQFQKPYIGGHTLPKDELKYCNILKNNINSTNYCKPDDCYYTTRKWLNMPWMKKDVKPNDHAEFAFCNKITSQSSQSTQSSNYSPYTPFQYDPTWNEFKNVKKFPNACHSIQTHRFI